MLYQVSSCDWFVFFFGLAYVYKFPPGDNENSCETSDFSVIYASYILLSVTFQ